MTYYYKHKKCGWIGKETDECEKCKRKFNGIYVSHELTIKEITKERG